MLKISIPQPCHEDWNEMSPNEQGRHCSSCAKTVVDFTVLSDDEVKNFFINKKEERVCGRFKQTQLQQIVIDLPQNIFRIEMPVWKKFLVASLVVFSATLFSCNTSIDGQLVKNGEALEMISNIRSTTNSNNTMGVIGQDYDTIPRPAHHCNNMVGMIAVKVIKIPEEQMIKGDVAMVITDTVKPKKNEPMLMGKPALETIINHDTITTRLKLKDPPKADPADCNKNTYY